MKVCLIFILLASAAVSCSVAPEPIHYGEDNCVLCQMTIMDHRYGTEIVTTKGKVFKFDSIECLVEYMLDDHEKNEQFSLVLVTSFDQPGKLIDAHESHVLQSKSLPSPMGIYLTAFSDRGTAEGFREKAGGKIYEWESLLENFPVIRKVGL
jgi:copper chaperone NosL